MRYSKEQALVRAYFKTKNALPGELAMFGDREICTKCEKFLPALLEQIGVDRLRVVKAQTGAVTTIVRSGLGRK